MLEAGGQDRECWPEREFFGVCMEESCKNWHLRSAHSQNRLLLWLLRMSSSLSIWAPLWAGSGDWEILWYRMSSLVLSAGTTSFTYQLPHHWQATRPFCAPVSFVKWGEIAAVLMRLLHTNMVPVRSLAWLRKY